MDDGETIKTNDQNHQIPDHVSFMSVDSAFASDGSSYKPPVAPPGGGSCCGDTEVLFQNVNDLETQVKEARDELEALNRNSEDQEAESLNPRPPKRFVFPPSGSPAKSAPPLHSGGGASIASGRSSTISKIIRKSPGASVCGASSSNKAATASTAAATPKSFATAKSRNTSGGSSSVAGTTIKSIQKKKGKSTSKNGSSSSSSLAARSKKGASSSSLAGSKKSSGTAGPNTRRRAAKEKQQQQELNVETVDTFSL